MPEQTVAELIKDLSSPDGGTRHVAVRALGLSGDPLAVGPLIAALTPLTHGSRADDWFAEAVILALGRLGDARAVPAVLDALVRGRSAGQLPQTACTALVSIGGTGAIPVLRELLLDKGWGKHAELLARTIARLGGPGEGPFLTGLLAARTSPRRIAAAAALAEIPYQEAVPALRKVLAANNPELRMAAVSALGALGDPRVDADVRKQLERATGWPEKSQLLHVIATRRVTPAAPALLAIADDPAWHEDGDRLRLDTLRIAAELGLPAARQRLAGLVTDPAASPCGRATAAISLLEHEPAEFAGTCLAFLLDFLTRAAPQPRDDDPRDGFARRGEALRNAVRAVSAHATACPEALLPVAEVLDTVRRSDSHQAQLAAWEAVPRLTPTQTYAEFDAWRATCAEHR